MRFERSGSENKSTSAPPMRLSMLSLGGSKERATGERDSPKTPSQGTESPKRLLGRGTSKPKLNFGESSGNAMTLAGQREASADDLAPTTAEAEAGGNATQGDFLMHARARRQQMSKIRSSSSEDLLSSSGGLDDTQVHSPTSMRPSESTRVRPRQLMRPSMGADGGNERESPLPIRPRVALG